MRVYISGKIGEEVISEATRQKFARAEEMLLSKGHEVVNPVSESYQEIMNMRIANVKLEWKEEDYDTKCETYDLILLFDIHAISECDAIYMLEDWEKSPGAGAELSFAMATGKKMLFASREQAALFLEEEWRKANKAMNMRTPRHKYVDLHLHELWMPIEQK